MKEITSTLLAEGSSDGVLIPLLQLLLQDVFDAPIAATAMANLSISKSLSLTERITQALSLFPSEILFVHRDSDAENPHKRTLEILSAVKHATPTKLVCVVPVRMTETWLLTQDVPIRRAAGNPHGTIALNLPPLKKLETLIDPKETLFQCLRIAKDGSSRQMHKFIPEQHRHKVGENTTDLSKLRLLPSFMHLENQLREYSNHRT